MIKVSLRIVRIFLEFKGFWEINIHHCIYFAPCTYIATTFWTHPRFEAGKFHLWKHFVPNNEISNISMYVLRIFIAIYINKFSDPQKSVTFSGPPDIVDIFDGLLWYQFMSPQKYISIYNIFWMYHYLHYPETMNIFSDIYPPQDFLCLPDTDKFFGEPN